MVVQYCLNVLIRDKTQNFTRIVQTIVNNKGNTNICCSGVKFWGFYTRLFHYRILIPKYFNINYIL